jgi:membrane-associated phospholipid phosphatase
VDSLQQFGLALIQSLQTLSPALDAPMNLVSFLGTLEFYLIVVPLLYWLVQPALGIRLMVLLLGVDLVTNYFKLLLHQPRPYWLGSVQRLGLETTDTLYGLPSGHASGSVSSWLFLAYELKRPWLWPAAVVLIGLIGLSRLYLGVHFPHDVVAGWLLGLALLVLVLTGESWLRPRFQTWPWGVTIGLTFGLSVGAIVIALLVRQLIAVVADPAGWADFAREARRLTLFINDAGGLFGAVTGYVLMQRYARFQPPSTWAKRIACLFIGLAGVLLFWRGLDQLFALIAADETVMGYLWRYVRHAATAGWVTFGAPWLFLRFGLARPAR